MVQDGARESRAGVGSTPSKGHARLARALVAAAAVAGFLAVASPASALIYWADTGADSIGRASLDGTTADREFIPGSGVCGVAVDAEHVYWANFDDDSIGRADLDGTDVDQDFISGLVDPCDVAVDADHIYWANCLETGSIGRADIDGTDVDQDFITGAGLPCGVGVNATHVYWANCDSPGSVGRADIDGLNADIDLITGTDTPCLDLAVNATHLYWANSGGPGTIGRADLDGTNADQDFITGASTPAGVAVDATNVYWANFAGDSIGRATLGGANVLQDFMSCADGPQGLAVDSVASLPPLNDFGFGKLVRNKERGTATLPVDVPGPGTVELAGKGIKGAEVDVAGCGEVTLKIRSEGKKRRQLNETGRVMVTAKVTYDPDGGEPNTESMSIRLVKRP